jgi:hypothetical protein
MSDDKIATIVVDKAHVGIVDPNGKGSFHFLDFLPARWLERRFTRLKNNSGPLDKIATQEEYFTAELNRISQVKFNLKIYNWDAELMDRSEYLEKLMELSQGKISVSMIIPADVQMGGLAALAADIRRLPGRPDTGYAIFDNREVSYWDTTKKSMHPNEHDSVIYRLHRRPPLEEVTKLLTDFGRQQALAEK